MKQPVFLGVFFVVIVIFAVGFYLRAMKMADTLSNLNLLTQEAEEALQEAIRLLGQHEYEDAHRVYREDGVEPLLVHERANPDDRTSDDKTIPEWLSA